LHDKWFYKSVVPEFGPNLRNKIYPKNYKFRMAKSVSSIILIRVEVTAQRFKNQSRPRNSGSFGPLVEL